LSIALLLLAQNSLIANQNQQRFRLTPSCVNPPQPFQRSAGNEIFGAMMSGSRGLIRITVACFISVPKHSYFARIVGTAAPAAI